MPTGVSKPPGLVTLPPGHPLHATSTSMPPASTFNVHTTVVGMPTTIVGLPHSIPSTTGLTATTPTTLVRPPLSLEAPSHHYPPDHPLAGQPRPPLDMLAQVSHTALSSAGSSLPTSLPSPPVSQHSPEMMRMGFPGQRPMGPAGAQGQ